MVAAIVSLTALGVVLGALLGLAARRLKVEENPLLAQVEAILPGTNCGQCGLPGCPAGARALVDGEAPVTLCPPGGRAVAKQLADLLGVDADLSGMEDKEPRIAFINEDLCIGCTRCFQRCPVDALIGAPKQMHQVIADVCTGCELCMNICPTECIHMIPVTPDLRNWYWPKPEIVPGRPPVAANAEAGATGRAA